MVGAAVTVGYGYSGSSSLSLQRIDSDYASVTRQTGIKAGDGGFNIAVKGNTDLTGAVIASNQLSTGSLTSSGIRNHSDFTAFSINISAAASGQSCGAGDPLRMNQELRFNENASHGIENSFWEYYQKNKTGRLGEFE